MRLDAERIRELRNEQGLSQEALAESAGLSVRTIQRVEARGLASGETAMALAAVFDTRVDQLEDTGVDQARLIRRIERGHRLGIAGIATGAALAVAGTIADTATGGMEFGSAGLVLGAIGLVAGLCCVLVGRLSTRHRSNGTEGASE